MGQIPGRALALALILAALFAALPQLGLSVATADTPPQSSNPLAGRGDVLKFTTRQAGVVTISAADLAEAGWEVAQLDPTQIHAWRAGRAVPLDVQVDAAGRLQALRLAVAPSDSRWSDEAVSWLSVEPAPGLRASLPEARTGWTWDADELYIPSGATLRGDRWWSAQLNTDVPRSVALDLPIGAPAGTPLALALHPSGTGGALQVAIDGQLLGAPELASARPQTITLTLPQPLPPGRRMLTLTSHAPDPVLLDQITLPKLVVPLSTLPTPRLQRHTPANATGAGDTLILTHISLRPALDPL
ncbi:MAG TPA: hypothetical protein VFS21_16225, partial [Roseiflexaceae bacterium]|nr:hypothetical protein [Roseiflexaceae bacterium]